MAPTDEELVAQVQAREAEALETLFERYHYVVRRHVVSIVRDEHAAEDLVQEAFLRVWTRAEQWDGRGAFRAWLFRIATNLGLNHLRTVRRRGEQPLETPAGAEEDDNLVPGWMMDAASLGPEAMLERTEHHELLRRFVETLPEEKREVLHLVYEEELNLREVACALSIPEGTVKSRLHYAMRHLAREWEENATEWEGLL